MDGNQFQAQLEALLRKTLDEGPGPRVVAHTMAHALTEYIFNEAGAVAQAIEEVQNIMDDMVREAEEPV